MTELDWQKRWDDIKELAVRYHDEPGRIPLKQIQRMLQRIEDMFGHDWLADAVTNGHSLIVLLTFWPGTEEAYDFINLISYAGEVSGDQAVVDELVKRTKTCGGGEFTSILQELRVLRALNFSGLPTRKALERKQTSKGRRTKTQDLICSLHGLQISVEVSELFSTDAHDRASRAFQRITHIHDLYWSGRGTVDLNYRPYSSRHVSEIEDKVRRTIETARHEGLASLVVPDVIRYVIWESDKESEAVEIHRALGLTPGKVQIKIESPSPISPFRVVEKLREKKKQAPEGPWVLILRAPEGLYTQEQAELMARECCEYIYDFDNLLGVVLYHSAWGGLLGADLNINTRDVTVETTGTGTQDYQQTIILKNRFCRFRFRRQLYSKVLSAGRLTHWEPKSEWEI